jgi:hypothetical protein
MKSLERSGLFVFGAFILAAGPLRQVSPTLDTWYPKYRF